jgi:DNA polymerase III gamma/tau subunit
MSNPLIKEDFLTTDPPIPGQNYFCFSCVWPEKTLRRKELFLMKHFLQNLLTNKLHLKKLMEQQELNKEISYQEVEDLFESYVIAHSEKVFQEFDETNDFKTSTRGIKFRGVYDTLKEARVRAEVLKRKDPNFDTWIGQAGYWCPLEPHANGNESLEQQFSEPILNQLYTAKQDNTINKETVFDPVVQAEMERKEAQRRESELNQLVKTHNDNIENGRDQFQKEVQRKKDSATEETERLKNIQQKVREKEEEKAKAAQHSSTENSLLKKKKKKKVKRSEVTSKTELTTESKPTLESVPTPTSNSDSLEKIRELRKILDERELALKNKPVPNDECVTSAADDDTNVNNSLMYSDKGQDIFDGPDSDPWMARKREMLSESSTTSQVERKTTTENNNLDHVIKKIL